MNFLVLFLTFILLSTCSVKQADFNKLKSKNDSLAQRLVTKDAKQSTVRIKNSVITELTSVYTKTSYDIYISYPNSYASSGKNYPVLVVLDAEVNFGAVSYIAQRLIKDELIPELFVVGIAYQGDTDEDGYYSLRSRDFTPTSDKTQEQRIKEKFGLGTGGAESFVKFLSLELFPHLVNNYPIKTESKSIYGHSFGGLFGFHLLLNHPTLFDNYVLLSPSLWWDKSNLLRNAKISSAIASKRLKLYVGTGSLEESMIDDHLEMVHILKYFNADSLQMKSEILDQETHRTIFGRGFTNGLRFIYSK